MVEVVIIRRFRVNIPKEVREKLGIRIGDFLRIKVEDDRIIFGARSSS